VSALILLARGDARFDSALLGYSSDDLDALWLTFELAGATSALLLVIATPLAWWLARSRGRGALVVEALVALPLVLPPTVLGFYLLCLMSPQGPLGRVIGALGLPPLAFSFSGILLGSLVYSLPFAVQPLRDAFQSTGTRLLEVAATLRAPPLVAFWLVVVPLARRGFLSAAVLSFAHTLGEFGVVLMIGGSIPRRTETAAIAIFRHVEAMDYGAAHRLSSTLLALCFLLLLTTYAANRRARMQEPSP
jgi:molybdate transport system permease protein